MDQITFSTGMLYHSQSYHISSISIDLQMEDTSTDEIFPLLLPNGNDHEHVAIAEALYPLEFEDFMLG
jgi:hypothetical protein